MNIITQLKSVEIYLEFPNDGFYKTNEESVETHNFWVDIIFYEDYVELISVYDKSTQESIVLSKQEIEEIENYLETKIY